LETAKTNTKITKAFFSEKSQNFRYKSTYLKIKIENRLERFYSGKSEWDNISANDSILTTIGR